MNQTTNQAILEKRIAVLMDQMTVSEKVGQLFMMAYTGQDVNYAKTLIKDFHVGGFYISNENAETHQDAFALTRQLNFEAQKRTCDAPLILAVDQEGSWSVLSKTSIPGPGNLAVGRANNTALTEQIYAMFAREMACAGYNTILAPCSDVNSNPDNPIIGVRSFGKNPSHVAQHVKAAVRGLKSVGVLSTLKHFPGHGNTGEDTHRKLPTVDKSLSELLVKDLVPFQAGIDAGVDIVMTSHIIFPAIDDTHPSTLSSKILQGLLRDKMGFKGIIVTDSMNMWAMRKNYDPAQAAIMALQAGANIVMLSEEVYENSLGGYQEKQKQTIQGVIDAVTTGQLDESIIDKSLKLVLHYRYGDKFPQHPTTLDNNAYGNDAHKALARQVAQKATQIIRNDGGAFPLKGKDFYLIITSNPACQEKILNCRGIGPNDERLVGEVLMERLKENCTPYNLIEYGAIDNFINSDNTDRKPIVLVTENYPIAGYDHDITEQADIVKRFVNAYGDRVMVMACRSDDELSQYPDLKTYVCTYSSRPVSVQVIGDMLSASE